MKNIANIKSWVLVALMSLCLSLGFSACSDDDTAPFHKSQLHSFGPCPVLRGETIRIIGSGLSNCSKVIFPVDVEVSNFVSKTDTEIVVEVPQEAVPGHLKLVIGSETVESVSLLSFEEPVSVESVAPLKVLAGDEVVVKGDYLNNIASVVFANNFEITTEDFTYQARKELRFNVPAEATSGKITFTNGDEWELEWDEPLEVAAASVTSVSKGSLEFNEAVDIYGENLQLIKTVEFPGSQEVEDFTVAADGSKLTVKVPAETCSGAVTLKQYNDLVLPAFDLTVPTISVASVSPAKNLEAGQTVTITGSLLDRVIQIDLPGGEVLFPALGFSVSNSGNGITFTVPSSMVDGAIKLTQNSNISVETDVVSMRRMGNVIWQGNIDLGGWSNNLEMAAEKNDNIWEAVSSAIKGPGKLTVNFEEDMTYTWWQFKPCYRKDWDTLWDNVSGIVGHEAGATSWTVNLTAHDVEELYGSGLAIGGCYCTIKSLEWESADAPTEIWSGNTVFDGGWGNNIPVDASAFADAKDGSKLYFNYELDTTSNYWQIKCMDGWWSTALSYNTMVDPTYQCVPLEEGSTQMVQELNAADVELLKERGLVVCGCYVTIKSICLK
jgi:hypothetical protein